MTKMPAFVKKLVASQARRSSRAPREDWAAAAQQAHADGQDKLISEDVLSDETMENSRDHV